MVLRHADGQRWRHQATDRIAHAFGNKLRIEVIGADQPVWPVLLGRTDRDDDAARRTQIILHLMPSGQRELHGSSPAGSPYLAALQHDPQPGACDSKQSHIDMTCKAMNL